MTLYEGMFLFDSADAAQNWDGLKEHVLEVVTRHGGEVLYTERWQDRKLAYEVKGRRKGTYLLVYFKAEGEAVSAIRREAQLSDRILRVLILRNERGLEEIEERKAAQAKQKVQAPAVSEAGAVPPVGEEEEEVGLEEAERVAVDDYQEEDLSHSEETGQEDHYEEEEEPLPEEENSQEEEPSEQSSGKEVDV